MDVKKIKDELVQWIKDWFEKNGKGCTAVIGLSGGKDSTICAALLAEALGKENVIGVAIPDHGQGLNGADEIAEQLGINFMVMPIENITGGFYGLLLNGKCLSEQAQQNIPPRIRMTMLYAIAQTYNGRVCCCDNASENYLGYSTLFGDDADSFAPLGNLTVTEIREIGDYMGLPHEWVHKTPDDGLPCSSPDEKKFGFSYETLDRYIRFNEIPNAELKEKIDRMHRNSQFKRDIIHVPAYCPYIPDLPGIEEEVIELEFYSWTRRLQKNSELISPRCTRR
jgi:NAD+ synthase